MKKPYVKKYGRISTFTVWIVDGSYIRKHVDPEFTNFGHHHRFSFIPKHEFWIDKEFGDGDESVYFINNMLAESWFMSNGSSWEEAYDKANEVEMKTRQMFESMDSTGNLKRPYLKKYIYRTLLKKYSKGIKVYVVNGRMVRNTFYLDFTMGGHDKVYKFVPKAEIWIDDDVSQRERKFILLHEIHERNLMSKGWSYIDAHRKSNIIERFCRHNPDKFDELFKRELDKIPKGRVIAAAPVAMLKRKKNKAIKKR